MVRKYLNIFKTNQRVRQIFLLFSVNIVSIPLGIIISIFLSRYLGKNAFGDYMFINNLFNLAVVIGSFGFFYSGNRALVLANDKQKVKEYYGAEIIILVGLTIVLSIILIIYIFYDKNIQEKGLRNILFYLIPFIWVYFLIRYFEILFQADNQIELLAKSRLFPKLFFFLLLSIIYFIPPHYNLNKLTLVWSVYLLSQIIVFFYIIPKVNPSFKNFKLRSTEILNYNRIYGFDVYIGSAFAVGSSFLTGILISYFGSNNVGVGYFSLASTFALPLTLIPNIISTTKFKDFSTQDFISKKLYLMTATISLLALIFILIIVPPFINIFYGKDFHQVILLNAIICIGVIFYGFADFINRFLGAHGEGKALRNSSFIVGSSLLIFNLLLIPKYGELGAAYVSVLAGTIYFINMLWGYKKLINKINRNHFVNSFH